MEKVINGEVHTRDSIVTKHKGLVHKECHKLKKQAKGVGQDYEDIVSIGFMGLIKAFDYFDGEKFPVRFSTYAVPMIRGEIQRVLRGSGTGVNYSRGIKELAFSIRANGMDELSIDAISTELEEGRKKVIHALNFLRHGKPSSLDQPVRDSEGDRNVSDLIGEPDDITRLFVQEFLEVFGRQGKIHSERIDGRADTSNYCSKDRCKPSPSVAKYKKDTAEIHGLFRNTARYRTK
ncbi:sigma-70 family RNA polymerase sigma factor [Bacillus sp. FSL K6-3431]|uniref:sigma-70 family RNA polymerase sigma factor n=1 Tax=Bacillus sp. FSL K6-3431 TaxID=2921500 RepID=UPI0030F6366F